MSPPPLSNKLCLIKLVELWNISKESTLKSGLNSSTHSIAYRDWLSFATFRDDNWSQIMSAIEEQLQK